MNRNGLLLEFFKDILLSEIGRSKIKYEESPKEEVLGFSSDIGDTQDYCFKEGIYGNCNNECECYGADFCEYMEITEEEL